MIWFWCPSSVPRGFGSFILPPTPLHMLVGATKVPQRPLSAFQSLESLCVPFGFLNLLVCFCGFLASWRFERETSTALFILLQQCSSGWFGVPLEPLCFFSSVLKGLGVVFWGYLRAFNLLLGAPALGICVLWCPKEPSMCSQDYQSHHTAVRQGQGSQSHSHQHGDGKQGHIFLSHSPVS